MSEAQASAEAPAPATGQATAEVSAPAPVQQAAPAQAVAARPPGAAPVEQGTAQKPTKPPKRASAGRLRAWGAATLVASALTGVTALGVTTVAGTDTSVAYRQDIGAAVTSAQQVDNAADAAFTSGPGTFASDRFEEMAGDLAARIPVAAANAPAEDEAAYSSISRELNSFTIAVTAGSAGGSTDSVSALQQYRQGVLGELQRLQHKATNPSPVATGVFTAVSLVAIAVAVGAAVVLARTTKRVLNLRVTLGIVLLVSTATATLSTLTGQVVWLPGISGAVLFTGAVFGGGLIWSGIAQRAQEYR